MQFHNSTMQTGNVLFIILIAVALFAALSYAVTQSTRSGGNTGKESDSLLISELMNYGVNVQTAVTRLLMRGVDPKELIFDSPADFEVDQSPYPNCNERPRYCVYHPQGGGAFYRDWNTKLGLSNNYTITARYEIPLIGTTVLSDIQGNEVTLVISGISEKVCRMINEKVGLGPIFPITSISDLLPINNVFLGTQAVNDGTAWVDHAPGFLDELKGQPEGCFWWDDPPVKPEHVIYYRVLIER